MKVSALSHEEVLTQLQILEYIEMNTRQGLTEGDRIYRRELEEQERLFKSKPQSLKE